MVTKNRNLFLENRYKKDKAEIGKLRIETKIQEEKERDMTEQKKEDERKLDETTKKLEADIKMLKDRIVEEGSKADKTREELESKIETMKREHEHEMISHMTRAAEIEKEMEIKHQREALIEDLKKKLKAE